MSLDGVVLCDILMAPYPGQRIIHVGQENLGYATIDLYVNGIEMI